MKKFGFAARLLVVAVVLSLAAFAVAGCGSDDKKDTVSTDASQTSSSGGSDSGQTKEYSSGETVGKSKKVVVESDADMSAQQQAVIDKIGEFADATANKDYKALCNDILSKQAQKIGGDCVATFEKTGAQLKDFKISVNSVKIAKDGKTATAVIDVTSNVAKAAQSQNLSLVKEDGDWRIQILGQ
ncbi:MAG: hypothetical protein QM648_11305 [Solirubrobacterales bacterium]